MIETIIVLLILYITWGIVCFATMEFAEINFVITLSLLFGFNIAKPTIQIDSEIVPVNKLSLFLGILVINLIWKHEI